eukprot:839932-Amphidinium_carterae.1
MMFASLLSKPGGRDLCSWMLISSNHLKCEPPKHPPPNKSKWLNRSAQRHCSAYEKAQEVNVTGINHHRRKEEKNCLLRALCIMSAMWASVG